MLHDGCFNAEEYRVFETRSILHTYKGDRAESSIYRVGRISGAALDRRRASFLKGRTYSMLVFAAGSTSGYAKRAKG